MRIVIVPNHISDAINTMLDREILKVPDAEKDRPQLYSQLLEYYDQHGALPDFSLVKNNDPKPMTTAWFSFGQSHAHQCGKHLLNRDTILEITAPDPRAKMFELFGNKWSMEYDQPPDMRHFPKGIIKL